MPSRRVHSPGRLALALVVASLVCFDGGLDAGLTAEPHARCSVGIPCRVQPDTTSALGQRAALLERDTRAWCRSSAGRSPEGLQRA